MIPVVTPNEMVAIDEAAAESVEVLIERAGRAVANTAMRMLGGTYGRRVVVIAGPGNNGRDGVAAAERLRRRGVRVQVIAPDAAWPDGDIDLVIDAAFGTGLRRAYASPIPPLQNLTVLAVDIPSGLDGVTGLTMGSPAAADVTVTFAALKPGLLLGVGPEMCGDVECVDIGLDAWTGRCAVVEPSDISRLLGRRSRTAHKWTGALWVIGGSPGMSGAPALAAHGAFRAGAGYVRASSPGLRLGGAMPTEVVHHDLPLIGWSNSVRLASDRIAAVVVGPGLGREQSTRDEVCSLVTSIDRPMVVDGDGLWAVAELKGRMSDAARILTPHDGEFAQLTGSPPGDDRVDAARRLALTRSAVVVLKGPTTVVADPSGECRLIIDGDQRLATAGTGDVLSGVIGAMLAAGMDPFDAASVGCEVHAIAARRCRRVGMIASDLPLAVSEVLSELEGLDAR